MLKYLLSISCILGGRDRKVKDVILQWEWHHDGHEDRVPQKKFGRRMSPGRELKQEVEVKWKL